MIAISEGSMFFFFFLLIPVLVRNSKKKGGGHIKFSDLKFIFLSPPAIYNCHILKMFGALELFIACTILFSVLIPLLFGGKKDSINLVVIVFFIEGFTSVCVVNASV